MSARQVFREALEELEAGDELRLVHEFVGFMRLIDRTGAADDRRQTRRLEMAGFGRE